MNNVQMSHPNGDTDHPIGNKDNKYYVDVELHDKKKKIKKWHSLKQPIWEWVKLFASPLLLVAFITVVWNYKTDKKQQERYQSQLVEDYMRSITELLLDQYHHGKSAKYPEISVEEVEAFVRARTANTLQALEQPKPNNIPQQITFWLDQRIQDVFPGYSHIRYKQNLIDFLSEGGIGFWPPYNQEKDYKFGVNVSQNICPDNNESSTRSLISQPKDITFHRFFCDINLSNPRVKLDLHDLVLPGIILERAKLDHSQFQNAILYQADLQGAILNQANLEEADLTRANLKGAFLREANLDKAKLDQANFRGAWLGTEQLCTPQSNSEANTEDNADQQECTPDATQKKTSLQDAHLRGANFKDANLKEVDLKNANLSAFGVDKENQTDPTTGKVELQMPTNLRNTDLRGANLWGADLSMANIRGAKLADEKNSTDSKPDSTMDVKGYRTSDLEGAIYDDDTIFPSDFPKDKMIRVHCELDKEEYDKKKQGEKQRKLDLSYVDLRDACLSNANLTGVKLVRADLRGADLSNAQITTDEEYLNGAFYNDKTKLPPQLRQGEQNDHIKAQNLGMIPLVEKADLRDKDIRYVDLSGVSLEGAKLQGTQFNNIDFDDKTNFTDVQFDEDTILPFSTKTALKYGMRYAPYEDNDEFLKTLPFSLWIAEIQNTIIYDKPSLPVNWHHENHQKANLRRAILKGGWFEQTNLTQAQLQEADLTHANLKGADLTDANLRKAILINAHLENADLVRSDLRRVDLTGAKLQGADLTDADLRGAELDGVEDLENAVLCRTILPNDVSEIVKQQRDKTTKDCSIKQSSILFRPND